jgi:hypothetical protein
MATVGFTVSHYLNATVDSRHRATVLSLKGLAFNLGYGFVSLLFALALRACRDSGNVGDDLAGAWAPLPLWLTFTALVIAFMFRTSSREADPAQLTSGIQHQRSRKPFPCSPTIFAPRKNLP